MNLSQKEQQELREIIKNILNGDTGNGYAAPVLSIPQLEFLLSLLPDGEANEQREEREPYVTIGSLDPNFNQKAGSLDAGEDLLSRLSKASKSRQHIYSDQDWTLPEWGNALAGEVGELCNVIKKVHRGDFTLDQSRKDIAHEAADVVIYLDLLCQHAGIILSEAIVEKFNLTSDKIGCPNIKLSLLSQERKKWEAERGQLVGRVRELEDILLSRPMADESIVMYIKNRLCVRGFPEETITNNRGMIGAVIDEMENILNKHQ